MLKIIFGLSLDESSYPASETLPSGILLVGPQKFLHVLETHLGLQRPAPTEVFLRLEQYRQALKQYLLEYPTCFFAHSFHSAQFAVSADLLNRRDELLLEGWDFEVRQEAGSRLMDLARVESIFQNRQISKPAATPGFAERFNDVVQAIVPGVLAIEWVELTEPLRYLPAHWQRLINKLKACDIRVKESILPPPSGDLDLHNFQNFLLGFQPFTQKVRLKADGSLLILRGQAETELAAYLANLLRRNPAWRPACLIPSKNRVLDNAIIQEGLPSLGILSASLARPTMQILKLVGAFMWTPIDPYKILEFLTLPIKPLHYGLGQRIAESMAQLPGIKGESWYAVVLPYLQELENKEQSDSRIDFAEIRFQYDFWFERKQYDIEKPAPKRDAVEIYDYLSHWASRTAEADQANTTLPLLAIQASRVAALLEALPETTISYLDLERLVRTVYESAPIVFREKEAGHLPYVYDPGAFNTAADRMIWWNFIQLESDYFFSRWYKQEVDYLASQSVVLKSPQAENDLLIWKRNHAVASAKKQLLLVIPENINGTATDMHPLYGSLEAFFENIEDILWSPSQHLKPQVVSEEFSLPQLVDIPMKRLASPRPFVQLERPLDLATRSSETPTGLETLLYYPYRWLFRHVIKLHSSPILSVAKEHTLYGNLAHKAFENLLAMQPLDWSKQEVEGWLEEKLNALLPREGAVLLMYGKEPERAGFFRKVKHAAWSLINHLRDNDWKIVGAEWPLQGHFLGLEINGRADLVLQRGDEVAIVDFKWSGATRRKNMIKSEEDIQLTLYSWLVKADDSWAHTAYFILENGKLIARNQMAFAGAQAAAPDIQHQEAHRRILAKMSATYQWRFDQLKKGWIEIRCQKTSKQLDEIYGDIIFDLLEPKTEDAPFDEYKTLIGLVE